MRASFFIVLVIVLFARCSEESDTASLLSAPPYKGLTDSIRHSPTDAELYYRRGVLLFENGQPDGARADIQKAWTLQPNEEYGLSLARLLEKSGGDSATRFLQAAVKKHPAFIALQVHLARVLFDDGEQKQALVVLDSLLLTYPGQLDARTLKADILEAAGKTGEAVQELELAYEVAPNDAELAHNLAFKYAEAGNMRALRIADSLIRVDVRGAHAEPYMIKGIYYQTINRNTEALSFFDQAIVKDYNFLDAHMFKGQLLFNEKRYNEALRAFRLVSSISPTYPDAYHWLGKTGEAMNDPEEAKRNYERAAALEKTAANSEK